MHLVVFGVVNIYIYINTHGGTPLFTVLGYC